VANVQALLDSASQPTATQPGNYCITLSVITGILVIRSSVYVACVSLALSSLLPHS